MATPLVSVEGARLLRSTMRKAGLDMSQMKAAHAKVAKVAEGSISAAAPRNSGQLASTIRSSGTNAAAIVRAGFKRTPYPGANNWGWPEGAGGIKGSFGGNFWMQQGAKSSESAWLTVYYTEVEKILGQIKGA